ncbi:hypothetical protein BJV74DRAFT_809509 [Russula compacta]|nr:hypothetical protein BJV74DRAFT_809509 [Russula compacta]
MSPAIKKVTAATPSSEIDDIFAGKTETTTLQTNQHSSSNLKQKRRKKKRSRSPIQPAELKQLAPEIVLDPSTKQSDASTSKVFSHDHPVQPRKKGKIVETTKPARDKFSDSRGTGPRRKTDEGFAIYKEDELGIKAEAGGTPLCPFDCNCCF